MLKSFKSSFQRLQDGSWLIQCKINIWINDLTCYNFQMYAWFYYVNLIGIQNVYVHYFDFKVWSTIK